MKTNSDMAGAKDEPVRDNPAVQSKFDRSRGEGLKAPHMSSPGALPTSNPGPSVRIEPREVAYHGLDKHSGKAVKVPVGPKMAK